ncbi:PucC family protein [Rhodobacter sp. KR11]|uniref:PucC family protein n=1 Tax=Rhodobacter sp. KR11 TaxID=2974588 RepID=UPI00222353DF|nr:PucC family protein [Rhodobacter sp. KR11]MCW1920185.1 PucC family protein [Rhodobacter sp. KR11]
MILRPHHVAKLGAAWMPFADAASEGLPLGQLMRLALFQLSVGMAQVLMLGTLNRVMIVELHVPATLVALMIAIPVLVAPFRALIGHRSDHHRSAIGWKRVPYLWFGSLWQMGGLAVMPFALMVLSGDQVRGPEWAGPALAGVAFLMTGIGMHMTQTAGLALACDRASDETRPRVVAVLYVMYLCGMGISALVVGFLLRDFAPLTLVRVVQGCGLATLILNVIALWKQEKVRPMTKAERAAPMPSFTAAWADLAGQTGVIRLLATVVLGTLAFNMQDVLLEPYGGQILGLSVAKTTLLTALWSLGALGGFFYAARARGADPFRLAALGLVAGLAAFSAVIFAGALASTGLFFAGAFAIGFGAGVFGVAMLGAAMTLPGAAGLAMGAFGAAQATAAGLAVFCGGALRDGVQHLAALGWFGPIGTPALGYTFVYHLEIGLIFATLIVMGPLVRLRRLTAPPAQTLNLTEFPT